MRGYAPIGAESSIDKNKTVPPLPREEREGEMEIRRKIQVVIVRSRFGLPHFKIHCPCCRAEDVGITNLGLGQLQRVKSWPSFGFNAITLHHEKAMELAQRHGRIFHPADASQILRQRLK